MLTLIAILGIGFLIFVHELGHYLACRLTGTRTETFSVGFGPRLFGWEGLPGERRRFTVGARRLDAAAKAMDFRVSAIPLGGYVKMAGENPLQKSGAPDEFGSKSAPARIFIVCAGVLMNAIAAFVLYSVAFGAGLQAPPALVGDVSPGGPAWVAGLAPGDRVTAVDGEAVRTFSELQMEAALLSRDEDAILRYEREGRPESAAVRPRYVADRGILLLGIERPAVLEVVVDGTRLAVGPSEAASVAGVPVRGGAQAYAAIEAALAAGVDPVRIERGDEHVEFAVGIRPASDAVGEAPWKIAVEPWGRPEVQAARGRPGEVLEAGDVLWAAGTSPGGRVELEGSSAWRALRFRPTLEFLEAERAGKRFTVPVDARDAADAARFLEDVAAAVTPSARVRPIGPSSRHLLQADGTVGRYPRFPAQEAGLLPGDRIVAIGDAPVAGFPDILAALRAVASDATLTVRVRREDGTEHALAVKPVRLETVAGLRVEARPWEEPVAPEGVGQAVALGLRRTGREIVNVFRQIGAFFTGSLSFEKNIGGPVQLVKFSGSAAESSWLLFLAFLGYISVSLAVLNILPIPVLDGGHLLFILIEKVKGSPLKEATLAKFQVVGLVLILALLAFALRNDLIHAFS